MAIAGAASGATLCVGATAACDTTHDSADAALAAAAPGDRIIVRGQSLGPIVLGPLTRDLAIDARLNQWGTDSWDAVQAGVTDLGTGNSVLQVPFLASTGEPEPPLPRLGSEGTHSTVPANCDGWDADGDGFADSFYANGRCNFLLVQAAIDFAHPGGTVLVAPSAAFPDPTPQADRSVRIDRNNLGRALLGGGSIAGAPEGLTGLTLCGTTARSGRCLGDATGGDWLPQRAEWLPVPGSVPFQRNLALRMTTASEPSGLLGFGAVSVSVPGALRIADLAALEFDVLFEGSGCIGGSPRFQLNVDKDGDGDSDGNVFVYAEPCTPTGAWKHFDLLDGAARWDATQLVGAPFYRTSAQAHADLAAAFPAYRIVGGDVVWDSAWASPTGSVQGTWFDNLRLHDLALLEPQNHACGLLPLLRIGCPRHAVAHGAVLDGQGVPLAVVDVLADDVTVQGLTIRGPGPANYASAVRLGGEGQRIAGNILPGNAQLEAFLGSPAAPQVGVLVCCVPGQGLPQPASGYLVEGNDVSGWRTAGVYVAAAPGGPGTVRGNHFHTNARSGVQSENAAFATRVAIEDNVFGPNLLRGVHLKEDVGARIDGNRFDLTIPLTLDPRSGTGILADGSTLNLIGGNTFVANKFHHNAIAAVTLDALGTFHQPDVLFRQNQWRLLDVNVFGLWLTHNVAGTDVDARLEDWGVYEWRLLPLRVLDEGTGNAVRQIPFLLPDGSPEPPLPMASPSTHCAAAGFAPLSVQEALWCAHPAGAGLSWLTVPPSAFTVDPTPRLENIVIDRNRALPGLDPIGRPLWGPPGETLLGLIVCSSTAPPPGCTFDAARTILDGSAGPGPAVTLRADDVSFNGFTVRGSSPLLLADGASWSGTTPLVNGIKANAFEVTQDAAAKQGVVLRGTTGAFLTGNTIRGNAFAGSVAVNVEGGSGAEVAHTLIAGSGTGIRFADATDGLARANILRLPPRSAPGTIPSYGITFFRGSGHGTDGNTLTGPGWGVRIDGTTGLRSAGDAFVDLDAAIALTRTGSVQPDGLVVRDARFATPLALHIDTPVAGVVADLRLNTWGTDEWRVIEKRFRDDGAGNVIKFLPYRTVTGFVEPPPPSVLPANHCAAAGLTPLTLGDALGCAHAGGAVLLRPPATTPQDPPPYLADVTIDANSESQALDGLRLCSAPVGVDDCSAPQAQAVRLRGRLTIVASEVTLQGLTFEGPDTALRAERAVDARLNHWGAYRLSQVAARIAGPASALAEVVPFLDVDARTPILPPTAALTADREVTDRLTAVTFADASTTGSRPLAAWRWDFGDGAAATGATAAHTFLGLGEFTVRLTVVDEAELPAQASRNIRVLNLQPFPGFEAYPSPANRADPTRFTDTSRDRDGAVVAWAWDFGDGATSTAQAPEHTFAILGLHPVTLSVTDDDGASSTVTLTVEVVNLAPSPDFTRDVHAPMMLQPVQFSDTSADRDGLVLAWAWDFGDGMTSSQREPLHAFLEGGWHRVRLRVTDNDGATSEAVQDMYVCAPGVNPEALLNLEHVRVEFDACVRVHGLSDPV